MFRKRGRKDQRPKWQGEKGKKIIPLFLVVLCLQVMAEPQGLSVVLAKEAEEKGPKQVGVESEVQMEESQEVLEEKQFQEMIPKNLKEIKPIELAIDDLSRAVYGDEMKTADIGEENEILERSCYDPRVDAKELVTPVKNQDPFGTCWAFGALGALETSLIKNGLADNSVDLSEHHLAYFSFHNGEDRLHNSDGDEQYEANYLNYGGNVYLSANTLMNWKGAADEARYPYVQSMVGGLAEENAQDDLYHVNDIYFLSFSNCGQEEKTKILKKMIVEYGSLDISYFSDSFYCFESEYTSYNSMNYFAGRSNHEVQVLGWDDDFPRENFWIEPNENGAWIVKNSWGNAWGYDSGYFYVSYEDQSFGTEAAVYIGSDVSSYDHNYFHCNLSELEGLTTSERKMAEVFTIQNQKELLAAVSFGSSAQNLEYTLSLYRLNSDGAQISNQPEAGELLLTQKGSTGLPGFYTIPLEEEILVQKGDRISIVIQTEQESNLFYNGDQKNHTNPGESYVYVNDERWRDLNEINHNLLINLLTKDVQKKDQEYCTVKIIGEDRSLIKTCTVRMGTKLVPPVAPKGYEYQYSYDFTKEITQNMTVVASKVPKTYRISYFLSGGKNADSNPNTYTIETETFMLQPPSRKGFSTGIWYLDDAFTKEIGSIPKGTTGDLKLYAFYLGENELKILPQTEEIDEGEEITLKAKADAIYYTLDGSTPTKKSKKYTGPFSIHEDTTLKVITVKNNVISSVLEKSYVFHERNPVLEKKEYAVKIGDVVAISVKRPEGSTVDTIEWESKNTNVAWVDPNGYLQAVGVGETEISVFAYDYHNERRESRIKVKVTDTKDFVILPHTLNGKKYQYEEKTLVRLHAPKGAEIYYTLDGSKPDKKAKKYQEPFTIDKDLTLKAIYYLNGKSSEIIKQEFDFMRIYPVLSQTEMYLVVGEKGTVEILEFPDQCMVYGITPSDYFQYYLLEEPRMGYEIEALKPVESMQIEISASDAYNRFHSSYVNLHILEGEALTIYPKKGKNKDAFLFEEGDQISIQGPEGVTIFYTTDGSTPTMESQIYSGPFTIEEDTTIQAICVRDGVVSEVVSQSYIYCRMKAVLEKEAVTLQVKESTQVAIKEMPYASKDPDYENWYSLNENIATVESGKITGVKAGNTKIACEVYDHKGNFQTTYVSVNITNPDHPWLELACKEGEVYPYEEGEKIRIHGPEDATIYYTVDGSEPTKKSTKYEEPLVLRGDTVLKAIYIQNGKSSQMLLQTFHFYRLYATVAQNEMTMAVGERKQVEILKIPDQENGKAEFVWYSEDSQIASVKNGNITAKKEGITQIVLKVKDHKGNWRETKIAVTVTKTNEKSFYVEYELNGGINAPENKNTESVGNTILLYAPTKKDEIFEGWYLDANFEGSPLPSVTGEGEEKVTVYAKWKKIEQGLYITGVSDVIYHGNNQTFEELAVYDGEKRLTPQKDYSVRYQNHKNTGTATVKVLLKGAYAGTLSKNFIIKPASIENAVVLGTTVLYNNRNKTPNLTVMLNNQKLVKNKDYKVNGSGKNYQIVGINHYEGSKDVEITVLPKNQKQKNISSAKVILSQNSFVYDGRAKEPTIAQITLQNALLSTEDYVIEGYKNNRKAGTAKVIICGRGNYTGRKTINFKITKSPLLDNYFSVSNAVYTKGGAKPLVATTLVEGKDYAISRYLKNTRVGNAQIELVGRGSFSGKVRIDFTVETADVGKCEIIAIYNPVNQKKQMKVIDINGKELKNKTDFIYDMDEDQYGIVGIGNYAGENQGIPKLLNQGQIPVKSVSVTVNGKYCYQGLRPTVLEIQRMLTVTYKKTELIYGVDYELVPVNKEQAANTYYFYLVGKDGYTGYRKIAVRAVVE